MLEQFLLGLGKLSAPRFEKVFGQLTHWIGFRKNTGDKLLRDSEEGLLLKLLSNASSEVSMEVLELLLPDRWDIDIGDGSLAMKNALREKCYEIVAPKAAREALGFVVREGAIRSLSEHGRFPGVKYCFFHPRSPIWNTKLRDELLGLIRNGQDDSVIYTNVRDYMDLLVRGLQRGGGIDSVSMEQISELVKDEEFVRSLWRTATSREIQYRLQMSFLQARQSLISAGASEAAMPLTKELKARVDEDAQKGKEPPAN